MAAVYFERTLFLCRLSVLRLSTAQKSNWAAHCNRTLLFSPYLSTSFNTPYKTRVLHNVITTVIWTNTAVVQHLINSWNSREEFSFCSKSSFLQLLCSWTLSIVLFLSKAERCINITYSQNFTIYVYLLLILVAKWTIMIIITIIIIISIIIIIIIVD
jgi:hypothetical protein